jgi:repressor of nif and glnA expression
MRINRVRSEILKKLKKADKSVCEIYWDIPKYTNHPGCISWRNCYYHLQILKGYGLVTKKTIEDKIVWSLTEQGHKMVEVYE